MIFLKSSLENYVVELEMLKSIIPKKNLLVKKEYDKNKAETT